MTKKKMHLLGISITVLLSLYAVTVHAGQGIRAGSRVTEHLAMPEIRYPEADGSQGYYKSAPEIRITHRQAGAVTRYELVAADKTKKEGSLELTEGETEESISLPGDSMKDGENVLHVWMEVMWEELLSADKEPEEEQPPSAGEEPEREQPPSAGEAPEGEQPPSAGEEPEGEQPPSTDDTPEGNPPTDDTPEQPPSTGNSPDAPSSKDEPLPPKEPEIVFEKEIRFRIDSQKPQKVHFSYDRAIRDGSIYINEPLELTLRSEDEGSGMEAVYYETGDGSTGVLAGGSGTVTLNPGFHGRVEAYAMDKAGNQSERASSELILCENTPPDIQIDTGGGTDTWHSAPVQADVKVSDPALSSGIRSLKCYIGGELAVHKENEYQTGVTHAEAAFTVETPSEGGQGIPVIVETTDWAGNFRTESRLVFIDTAPPAIQSEGIHDHMITGEMVKGRIKILEENELAYGKLEVWKINSDEKRELLLEKKAGEESLSGKKEIEWEVSLEEDGIYEISIAAKDRAGHEKKQNSQVIVDKTNPVIRYVDQMQGVYVPYFQWNYGKEEVVQDSTDYSYDISLDGTFYTTGRRITKEGVKMLQIKAVDAAGNESTAEAIFQIDHTPPQIRIRDVEDGTAYEEMAAVSVSVDGKGEYIREISVNSEKMKLEADCQIFQQSFQEPGDYEIQVLAEDLAGNQQREQVTFRIEAQKQLAGGVWKPITKIFRNTAKAPVRSVKTEDEKQEKNPAPLVLLLCFALVVSARLLNLKMGLVKNRKRKYSKAMDDLRIK